MESLGTIRKEIEKKENELNRLWLEYNNIVVKNCKHVFDNVYWYAPNGNEYTDSICRFCGKSERDL